MISSKVYNKNSPLLHLKPSDAMSPFQATDTSGTMDFLSEEMLLSKHLLPFLQNGGSPSSSTSVHRGKRHPKPSEIKIHGGSADGNPHRKCGGRRVGPSPSSQQASYLSIAEETTLSMDDVNIEKLVMMEAVLLAEKKPLKAIFMHYASVDESPITIARLEKGVDYDSQGRGSGVVCHVMPWNAVLKFLQEFDVVPALLQRYTCQRLFDEIALGSAGEF